MLPTDFSHPAFVPGTFLQWAFDSTSLGWLKTCARQYYYYQIEGWTSRDLRSEVDLYFGLVFGQATERYDRAKAVSDATHDTALRSAVAWALEETWGWEHEAVTPKNRFTLIRSIIWYLDHWRDDPAATVILADGAPAVELTFQLPLDGVTVGDTPVVLTGHIDRLVTFNDETFVTDRKTTKTTVSADYFDHFRPDNQFSLYIFAGQIVYGVPVKGAIIDATQVAVGFSQPRRGLTYRTPAELEEWLDTTKWWIAQSVRYAEDGFWPMNDKSCYRCAFRKICGGDPSNRQRQLETHFMRREWNPLEVRAG